MVLGLTYGDLLIIAGGGFLLLGPKELPAFARLAGKAAGRAVALVNEFRSKLMTVANDAEVTKLHEEIQQGLMELRSIRRELQSGIDIMNPGPVAQRAFGLRPPQHEPTLPNVPGTQWAANGSSESMAASAHTGMATFGRGSPAFSPGMSQVAGVARPAVDGNEDGSGGAGSSGIMQPMPVSAVMAGRAPNRSSTVPTGADIMLDALAEEEVARQAQRFLRQQPGWPPSS